MDKKDDYIRIRVTKEQKELFKKVAEIKSMSMSEFLIVATEDRARRELEKSFGRDNLELRVFEVDKKLQNLKGKMELKRSKKKFFKKFQK